MNTNTLNSMVLYILSIKSQFFSSEYFMSAEENRFVEMVHLGTHSILFWIVASDFI